MKARITQMTVAPDGEPIFCENSFFLTIQDEAGGEYVSVRDNSDYGGVILINPEEWPALRDAIDHMVKECQS